MPENTATAKTTRDAWAEGYRAAMLATIGRQPTQPEAGAYFPADWEDHNPYRDEAPEYVGYRLQHQFNSGCSSAHWEFDTFDWDQTHATLAAAERDVVDAMDEGYPRENLRIVGIVVIDPTKEGQR